MGVDLPWLVACLLDVWKSVVYSIILVVLDVIAIAMDVLFSFVFDLRPRENVVHHAACDQYKVQYSSSIEVSVVPPSRTFGYESACTFEVLS